MHFGSQGEVRLGILVVDDDESTLAILEDALKSLGHVYLAENGEQALDVAKRVRPDVVLLDIEMPGMKGFDVCRMMKMDPDMAHASIIFITSHDDEINEIVSLESGAVDFLPKPINMLSCRLRVQNHLRMRLHAREVERSRQQLNQIVSHVPTYISFWSKEWVNLYSNDFENRWFVLGAEHSRGQKLETVLPVNLAVDVKRESRALAQGAIQKFEGEYHRHDHSIRYVQIDLSLSTDAEGTEGYLLTIVDVTLLRTAKQQLHQEKQKLEVTLNSIGDGVIATDVRGRITYMNPIAERLSGYRQKQAVGNPIEQIMHLQDASTGETSINPVYIALKERRVVGMALNCQMVNADGTVYRVEDSAAPIRDEAGVIVGSIIVFHDVSEAIAMSMKMSHLANHDQLTDLPNRVLLQDRIERAIAKARSGTGRVALLQIDIDHFKHINDSLGHAAGDELVRQMARRLRGLVGDDATLSRTGGDEFVIVQPGVERIEQADVLSRAIARGMHEPFVLEGGSYNVSTSVGISLYPDDADSQDQMMRHADIAMYRAKQEGRNRYCFFSEELKESLAARHQIEALLRAAIKHELLEVHYQPKIRLSDGKVIGAEALVRLRDEVGELVFPSDFIPVAADCGLMTAMGDLVLKIACRDCRSLRDEIPGFTMSVNIAASQVEEANFYDKIVSVVEDSGLQPGELELEVTESALMNDTAPVITAFEKLHDFGVAISLDDFGTGYSSLSYLKKFKLDVLKIDQSFVRDMLEDPNDYEIVQTIVALAGSLSLGLVAEGVETREHAETLAEMGCYAGQGYLFSKPVALQRLLDTLRESPLIAL